MIPLSAAPVIQVPRRSLLDNHTADAGGNSSLSARDVVQVDGRWIGIGVFLGVVAVIVICVIFFWHRSWSGSSRVRPEFLRRGYTGTSLAWTVPVRGGTERRELPPLGLTCPVRSLASLSSVALEKSLSHLNVTQVESEEEESDVSEASYAIERYLAERWQAVGSVRRALEAPQP